MFKKIICIGLVLAIGFTIGVGGFALVLFNQNKALNKTLETQKNKIFDLMDLTNRQQYKNIELEDKLNDIELQNYKNDLKYRLENYATMQGMENYLKEDWFSFNSLITKGHETIDKAKNNEEAKQVFMSAKKEIAGVQRLDETRAVFSLIITLNKTMLIIGEPLYVDITLKIYQGNP